MIVVPGSLLSICRVPPIMLARYRMMCSPIPAAVGDAPGNALPSSRIVSAPEPPSVVTVDGDLAGACRV